jgi:hypothetical protein
MTSMTFYNNTETISKMLYGSRISNFIYLIKAFLRCKFSSNIFYTIMIITLLYDYSKKKNKKQFFKQPY